MKKIFTIVALALAVTVSANAQNNSFWDAFTNAASGTTLSDLLSLFGGQTIYSATPNLEGTYSYAGSAVSVSKEGGDTALGSFAANTVASAVEARVDAVLAKIGIEPGTMTINFNPTDNTFTWLVAGIPLPGTYKVGNEEKTITLTFGKNLKNICLTGDLVSTTTGATMLFPAKRTAAFLKKVAAKLGEKSSTVGAIAKFADGYDNYKIGFKLTK